jgi:hypothetical protein
MVDIKEASLVVPVQIKWQFSIHYHKWELVNQQDAKFYYKFLAKWQIPIQIFIFPNAS